MMYWLEILCGLLIQLELANLSATVGYYLSLTLQDGTNILQQYLEERLCPVGVCSSSCR